MVDGTVVDVRFPLVCLVDGTVLLVNVPDGMVPWLCIGYQGSIGLCSGWYCSAGQRAGWYGSMTVYWMAGLYWSVQ